MTLMSTFCRNLHRRTLALAAGALACALASPTLAQSDAKAPAPSETKSASSDTKKEDAKDRKEAKSDKSSDDKKSEKSKADSKSSTSATKDSSPDRKNAAKTPTKSGETGAQASQSKDSKSASAESGKQSSAASNDRTKNTDNRPQPTSKSGNTDRKSQDAGRAFRDSEKEARSEREHARREVNELRENGDQAEPRARGGQDARDDRPVRDIDQDRNVKGDRDVRDDRSTREADIDRDVRDRRDVRDLDRRDTGVDVGARSDRDVSRTRIDNFRADSLTARQLGLTFGRADNRGLVIDNIARNAVLANVGLRRGDVIVSVAEHRITSEDQFIRWLFAQDLRNRQVTVVVLRDGRQVPIEVQPVRIIREIVNVRSDVDPLRQFGVVLDQRIADRVVVVRVVPDSPAFVAGIRPGDVIVTLSGRPVRGPQQFVQVLQRVEPGQLAVQVNRARQTQQFRVDMPVRRTVARPDLDVDRPAIERREERRENRIERREERRDRVPGVNNNAVPPSLPAGPAPLPRNH